MKQPLPERRMTRPLTPIEQAIEKIAAGGMVIVIDDEAHGNAGHIVMAAELATPESLAFMSRLTDGMVYIALLPERIDTLDLPRSLRGVEDARKPAASVMLDQEQGTTARTSAADLALTIRALVSPDSKAGDFCRRGDVVPLAAVPDGVLRSPGHTEAAVDLARLAGLQPGGVLAPITDQGGMTAPRPRALEFARAHGLPMITISELVAFRRCNESIIERCSTARLPTRYGVFTAHGYLDKFTGHEHVAMVMGPVAQRSEVLVRVHSECLTGEVLGSLRCDCRPQLDLALQRVAEEGCGVVVYLRGHEGRGIGLMHKLRAYALQDEGCDTVQANLKLGLRIDARDYSVGAQILQDLGVERMRLMTNNPLKYEGLVQYGLTVVERVPLTIAPIPENEDYLRTKQQVLGHTLDLAELT